MRKLRFFLLLAQLCAYSGALRQLARPALTPSWEEEDDPTELRGEAANGSDSDTCKKFQAQAPGDGERPSERGDWLCQDFHRQLVREAEAASSQASPEVLFVGDSIFEALRGSATGRILQLNECKGATDHREECERLDEYRRRCNTTWQPRRESAASVMNTLQAKVGSRPLVLARGGDATQHMIWRLQHGELPPSLQPTVIFLMAGINNLLRGGGEEDAKAGLGALVRHLRAARPEALLAIHMLLPCTRRAIKRYHVDLEKVNAFIRDLENQHQDVKIVDCSDVFRRDGRGEAVNRSLMPDLVHPNRRGHELWAECYAPQLASLLAEARRRRSHPEEAELAGKAGSDAATAVHSVDFHKWDILEEPVWDPIGAAPLRRSHRVRQAAPSQGAKIREQLPRAVLAEEDELEGDEEPWDLLGGAVGQPHGRRRPPPSGLEAMDLSGTLQFRKGNVTTARTVEDPPWRMSGSCKPASGAAWAGMGTFLAVWAVAASAYSLSGVGAAAAAARAAPPGSAPPQPEPRDPRWDRMRFHLMTVIIWTHWIGKWGLEQTRAGWAVLNWAFAFHVVGFVVLSGVFSARYAEAVRKTGLPALRRTLLSCFDIFLVYVIFSWLRGGISMLLLEEMHQGSAGKLFLATLRGTFLFHQGPWYLAALIVWRLAALQLWLVPSVLSVIGTLLLAAFCPYQALAVHRDPFAAREVLHYLPYFAVGLYAGQQRLGDFVTFAGRFTPAVCIVCLATLALVICLPLSWLFQDDGLRWVLLTKGVPPIAFGGYVVMLGIYIIKTLVTLAALALFATPGIPAMDRVIEAAGARSMCVYMVHMVFIMVPGEALCARGVLHLDSSGSWSALLLLVLALAVNLLCGSSLTARLFRPLLEPLATLGLLKPGPISMKS